MEVIEKKIEELKPYEKNPRNNLKAIDFVANSISEFGFKQPIVIDKDGVIVAGHTRYEASKKLGLKKVPCIIASDLTEEQIKAYRLADNKVSELAEWNVSLLNEEIADILNLDMSDFGFSLFDEADDNDFNASDEWVGMPEFEQNSAEGVQQIIVHFAKKEDVETFSQLVGQNITDKTKFIWFPKAETISMKGQIYD